MELHGVEIHGDRSLLQVGERVSFGGVFITLSAPIEIGNDVMIATGVKILTSTHNYNNNPMWKHRVDRPIKIGSNVWIGANAIILPGIKIGDYAVVGAGAVVTKHVPDFCVVGGNPAKFIRSIDLNEFDSSCVYPGVVHTEGFLPDDKIIKKDGE